MTFSFDIRGNLQPSEKHTISRMEFEEVFVNSFNEPTTRTKLYEYFTMYNDEFQLEITDSYAQWIGGSFVTTKENPIDLDFVNIIDADVYFKNEKIINSKFRSRALKLEKGLDAYFLTNYNKGDSKYAIFHSDSLYWYNLFTKTKKDRRSRQFRKGFIELIYNNYQL